MRSSWRALLACLVCGLVSLVSWPVVTRAEEPSSSTNVSLTGNPLVLPGPPSFADGQQAAAEEARRASPGAVTERAMSRTEYEGADRDTALNLAEKDFGIAHPSWVSPESQGGGHITKYVGNSAAVETLPDGKHVFVQSTVPLLSGVGSGQNAPMSLSLRDDGESYQPVNPLIPVTISKAPSRGALLPLGISVAPTQAATPEGSALAGNKVVYPGTAPDTDFMIEPLPGGVETSWQLRSEASPEDNSLRFTLPAGASLQLSKTVPGGAEIVSEGQALATIPPAVAKQSDGSPLPASYTISGDTLTTHVGLSGSVDFPVLVDPTVLGTFGSYGAGTWTGWSSADNCGTGCYGFFASSNQLIASIANAPWPAGYAGWWDLSAPGYWEAGGSRITRVDLSGVNHDSEQSSMSVQLGEDNGGGPVYTFNGFAGSEGSLPYWTKAVMSGRAMAVCAQGAGGHDGGEQPLCNEEYGASTVFLENEVNGWTSVYNWTEITGAVVRYIDNTIPDKVSLVKVPTGWSQYGPANEMYLTAHDEGLGIESATVEIPPGKLNSEGKPFFSQEFGCAGEAGFNGCSREQKTSYIDLSGLATGIYTLGATAYDAAGNFRGELPTPVIYIDHTPPKLSFGGSLYEANNGTIGNGNFNLTFSAEDGSSSSPQSGMDWIGVSVDGKRVSEMTTTCPYPTAVPAAGCYTLSGSWTLEGQKYGAGSHAITVTAEDWVGNRTTETFHVTINEAPYEAMGPGSVNIKTGDYKLTATDVSVANPAASLQIGRSYDSRQLTQGANGPLGPQWNLSLPDQAANGVWQSLQVLTTGAVRVMLASGTPVTFALNGSSYTSPPGYQTDVLTKTSSSPLEYRITDGSGNATIFTRAGSGEETEPVLTPSGTMQATAAGGLNKVTYTFTKTAEGIVEPTKVLAPYPSTINCVKEHPEELVDGCRELTFNYATSTTATGEAASEWGDYKGHLTRVYFTAWNPSTKAMATTSVAQYAYDGKGRLRAEWDPRISPALKTEYGYDTEGHITSLTPPGQETWAFTYGTIVGDANTGRLLKVLQAPASTALWTGVATKYTEAPHLSGSPVVGTRMTVAHGVWSPTPVSYAYQWQDCNKVGEECAPIGGATNPGYAIATSDAGHVVRAQVTATNGDGSTTASVATAVVTTAQTNEYALVSGSGPLWAVSGPDGNLWFTEASSNKIAKMTPGGSVTEYALPTSSSPRGIVSGPNSELWFADFGTSKIGRITTAGAITEYALPAGSEPWGITVGKEGNLWFTDYGSSKVEKMTTSGTRTEYTLTSGAHPYGIVLGSDGKMWFAEAGTGKVGTMTASGGSYTKYPLASGSTPYGIASGPEGSLWVTDFGATNRVFSMTTTGATTEYPLPAGSAPRGITTGPDGNLWLALPGTNKVGVLSPTWKGPYADSSASGYQMTSSGGVTYPAAGPTTGSSAITLDGSSGYLTSASTAAGNTNGATGVTLEAWIKPNNVADGSYQEIISKTYVAQIDIPPGVNHIRALFGNGSSWVASAEGGSLVAGQWAHVSATYNGSTATILINGSRVAQGAIAKSAFGKYNYPLAVGAYDYAGPTIGGYFWGSISDATVYNQPLSEFEILTDHNATTQEAYEALVMARKPAAYYPFTNHLHEFGLLSGSEPRGITTGPDGNIWIPGLDTDKMTKITVKPAEGETLTPEPGSTIEYNVPLSGTGLPTMTKTEVEKWGQKDLPAEAAATAIFPPDEAQTWPASDYKRATIYYLDSTNRNVNISSPTGGISTTEYDSHDNETRTLSARNRSVALKEAKPVEEAEHLSTILTYNTEGTELTNSLGPEHNVRLPSGSEVEARKQVKYAYDEGAPTEGGPYRLVTNTKESALTAGREEDVRTVSNAYSGGTNEGWKLHEPTSTITDPAGLKLTHTTVYSASTGEVLETQSPGGGSGNTGAHTSQIVYYTPGEESSVAVCQNHKEWANLPCQTQPAHQPEAGGLPNMPVSDYTYNMWDQPEVTTSTSGESKRVETQIYDAAGRIISKETTSTSGTALPKVVYEYNTETGLPIKQSTGSGAEEQKITSVYNKIGQLTSYTDADGAVATYEYENGKDGRLKRLMTARARKPTLTTNRKPES